MIEVVDRLASTPVISDRQYRQIMALNWKTLHTERVKRETGDDRSCVAYDANTPRAGGPCWLLARYVVAIVKAHDGKREILTTTMVPYVWAEWRDGAGRALSIDDPRLGEYMRSCDRHRHGSEIDQARDDAEAQQARNVQSKRDDMARNPRVHAAIRAQREKLGLIAHRKLGTQGGKISSANIWRSGAGAAQKPAILNSQGQPFAP